MKFYILGPLKVASSGGIVAVKGKRLGAVLGILLLHPSAIVPMERIIEGVWSEAPPRSAVENIRTYVWQLRSLVHGTDGVERLESHPAGYRLRAEPEELDLLRFGTLAAGGSRALRRGNVSAASVLLEQALSLWRGDVLSELDLGPVIRAKADALHEERRQIELDWIGARLALGEHADMVSVLRKLIGERPLDEDLWCHLVTTLHVTGRSGEALSAYARAREILITELGIEPCAKLQKVHAAVLAGREMPHFSPLGVTVRPWAMRAVPRQLPAGDPGFVGRQEPIKEVQSLVEEMRVSGGRRAVVVVSGQPGVGKSAMATAASAAVLSEFPDGQIYADLGGTAERQRSADEVLASVLDGFGLRPEAIPESIDRRRMLYRSLLAERRMLILLDNAMSASNVAPLIPGQGKSMLIVTSSRRLADVDADVRINLEPLATDAAVQVFGEMVGRERVCRESAAARSIVDACDGLPLAIRIAAARLATRPGYPLSVFREQLGKDDRVIDELALDGLAIRDRLDARYDALDADARKSFRALGKLEPISISAAGLGRLLQLSSDAADRKLERLVHECLLTPEAADGGGARYQMPRLLHIYARERLASE